MKTTMTFSGSKEIDVKIKNILTIYKKNSKMLYI